MRITETKLRKTIRTVIQESMAQQDILYLGNLLGAWKGTFGDWSEFCEWYNDVVMTSRLQYDEEMDDFLMMADLEVCPDNIFELINRIKDPATQAHPLFSTFANALRSNF